MARRSIAGKLYDAVVERPAEALTRAYDAGSAALQRTVRSSQRGSQSRRFEAEEELHAASLGTLEELRDVRAQKAAGGRIPAWQTTTPQYPATSSRRFIRDGYYPSSVVRACVDIRGRTFGQGDLEVFDRESGETVEHPLTDLLRHPTNVRGARMRWRRTMQDLDLTGNAIWEKVRAKGSETVVEIWRLDPQRVRIELSQNEWIKSYWYEVAGTWFQIPARNIIHWMFPDPDGDSWFGIPPILAAWKAVSIDSDLMGQMKVTLQNRAQPSVVLEGQKDVVVDEDFATEARRMWRKRTAGDRLGDVAIVGGVTVKVIGMTWKDMDLSEVIAVPESRIASVYGVPMIIVGRSNAGGDTGLSASSTYREGKLHFWFDTVSPLHADVAEMIEIDLLPEFPGWESLGVRFNTVNVPILQQDRLERAAKAAEIFQKRLVPRHTAQRMGGMPVEGPNSFAADAFNETIPAESTQEAEPQDL